ncbi:hypothetical protein LRP88_11791 [Fusarium phalaenopsidis]
MSTYHIREVDNRLQGRLALVTGTSGGIGSAIARALAAEGCDVVLHCNSSLHKVEALSKTLQSTHPDQLFPCVSADLSSREQTRGLVDVIFQNPIVSSKHKAISILVANAGLGKRIRDVQEIEEENWDEMMEVNARSQFVVTKSCLPGMRVQSWGRVILVGSIASKGGGINGCHYAATKGALTSMGLNLATLLAGEGVTVNTILPAMIGATDMIPTPKSTTWTSDTNLEALKATDPGLAIAASIPVHRLGQPDEVANVAVMMAKTGYLTGQEIVLSDSTWVPSWSVEGRQPTFGQEGYVAPFATHKNIWGDVPALDILKLDQNEGVQYYKDLALLFAASGDLRNVIKTVTSLPRTFRNDLTITINDNDLDVVARNIILLLTALLSAKPEDAATRMIHIWYSTFIRQSDLEFLHGVVRPNIERACSNLEGEDLDRLHSGTFSRGSYSGVNVVLPKKSWLALLKYLEVPEGLTLDQAQQVRTAVTLPAGHLGNIEHNYFPLLPAQRICWHRFRLDGVLLPFGASSKPFDTPNPAHWPYRGDLQPIHGWGFGEVIKVSTGEASMDHYGKLFYYLQEVFVKFYGDLRSRNLSFRLYNQDIQHLAGSLGAQSFARIELSNL